MSSLTSGVGSNSSVGTNPFNGTILSGVIGGSGQASVVNTHAYITTPSYGGGSAVINYIGSNKRGPYKKDKFNVSKQTPLGLIVDDVVGKVKTLAQIGEMLDNLKPNEPVTLIITKKP